MSKYLYFCWRCGAAFFDSCGDLSRLCLCQTEYRVSKVDASVTLADALYALSVGAARLEGMALEQGTKL